MMYTHLCSKFYDYQVIYCQNKFSCIILELICGQEISCCFNVSDPKKGLYFLQFSVQLFNIK